MHRHAQTCTFIYMTTTHSYTDNHVYPHIYTDTRMRTHTHTFLVGFFFSGEAEKATDWPTICTWGTLSPKLSCPISSWGLKTKLAKLQLRVSDSGLLSLTPPMHKQLLGGSAAYVHPEGHKAPLFLKRDTAAHCQTLKSFHKALDGGQSRCWSQEAREGINPLQTKSSWRQGWVPHFVSTPLTMPHLSCQIFPAFTGSGKSL